MLSDKSVDLLVSAPIAVYGQGEARRRAAALEAVKAAAKDLELDPMKPPIPRFAAGEDTLAAAVRVLGLSHASKKLEEYRRQRAACDELEKRFAALLRRRDELRVVELDRMRESLVRGRVPEPAAPKLRDELSAIRAELDTIGEYNVRLLLPSRAEGAVLREALSPAEWLGVCLYAHLLGEHLRAVTEDEPYNSKARRLAETANNVARMYEKEVNIAGSKRFPPEHDRAVRCIRWAVETADLHRLAERREPTIEELAGESAGAPA